MRHICKELEFKIFLISYFSSTIVDNSIDKIRMYELLTNSVAVPAGANNRQKTNSIPIQVENIGENCIQKIQNLLLHLFFLYESQELHYSCDRN